MLDLRCRGRVHEGRAEHAADEPSGEADDPVFWDDRLGGEGSGWSEAVRHRSSPAGRSGSWGDLSQHQQWCRRAVVLPDRRKHQAMVEGLPQEG
jgi:hypothetical protein